MNGLSIQGIQGEIKALELYKWDTQDRLNPDELAELDEAFAELKAELKPLSKEAMV